MQRWHLNLELTVLLLYWNLKGLFLEVALRELKVFVDVEVAQG